MKAHKGECDFSCEWQWEPLNKGQGEDEGEGRIRWGYDFSCTKGSNNFLARENRDFLTKG